MKFERVQILRFLAAAAVAVAHANATATQHLGGTAEEAANSFLQWGILGVDLFFVISGFIIRYTIATGSPDAWTFLRRRLSRIVPLYWLCLIAMFVFGAVMGIGTDQRPVGELALDLLRSFAFVAWTEGDAKPLLIVGWTLEYEMLFYALAALCLALTRRPALLLLGALAALVATGLIVGDEKGDYVMLFLGNTMLVEFMMGVLLAEVLVGDRPRIAATIVAATLMLAIALGPIKPWAAAVGAALLVGAAIWRDSKGPAPAALRPFVVLGDASYSIYLTHFFTLAACNRFITRLLPGLPVPAAMAIGALASILAGYAVYRVVERPMLHWVRRWGRAPRAEAAPA